MKTICILICAASLTGYNHTQKDETGTKGLIFFQDDNGKYGLKDNSGKVISMADDLWETLLLHVIFPKAWLR